MPVIEIYKFREASQIITISVKGSNTVRVRHPQDLEIIPFIEVQVKH